MLIGVEGLDGAGKSTAAAWLVAAARRSGLRAQIVRAGGNGAADRADHLRAARLANDSGARHRSFLAHVSGPDLVGQCAEVRRLTAVTDLLVLDRTFVSHIAGKLTTYRLRWNSSLVRDAYERLWASGAAIPCGLYVFLFRPRPRIIETLRARQARDGSLESFDAFLLHHPTALDREQRRLRRASALLGGWTIENSGPEAHLVNDLQRLWRSARLGEGKPGRSISRAEATA